MYHIQVTRLNCKKKTMGKLKRFYCLTFYVINNCFSYVYIIFKLHLVLFDAINLHISKAWIRNNHDKICNVDNKFFVIWCVWINLMFIHGQVSLLRRNKHTRSNLTYKRNCYSLPYSLLFVDVNHCSVGIRLLMPIELCVSSTVRDYYDWSFKECYLSCE